MLSRTVRLRSLRPLGQQTRLYGTVGGDDPAEFKARKGSSNTTLIVAGATTFFIIAMYSIMTGAPDKAADMTTRSDPEAVAHMKPPNSREK